MQEQDLDQVLSTLNEKEVLNFFKGMPEKERKTYSARALQWLDVCAIHNNSDAEFRMYVPGGMLFGNRQTNGMTPPKRIQKLLEQLEQAKVMAKTMPPQAVSPETIPIAEIAVLATAGLSDIKKRSAVSKPDPCYEVLSTRRPSWLSNWVQWITTEAPHTHWMTVRRLEREGVIQVEHNSNYYTAMALCLSRADIPPPPRWENGQFVRAPRSSVNIRFLLKHDETLVAEIWGMLADDQTMRLLLNRQPARGWRELRQTHLMERWRATEFANQSWQVALVDLCNEKKLEKNRLLMSVMALFTRFNLEHSESGSTLRIEWFTQLFDNLNPNSDEQTLLAQDYIRLLSCRNAKIVTWAATKLASIVEHPDFPVAAVCESIGTAFLLKGNEHSTQALKTLKAIADTRPSFKREVASATVEALESESQEVQKRALVLLEKLKFQDNELIAQMESKLSRVAIVHRARATEWLQLAQSQESGKENRGDGEEQSTSIETTDPEASNVVAFKRGGPQPTPAEQAIDLISYRQRQEKIPEDLRRIAGVDTALDLLENKASELDTLDLCQMAMPRLDPDKQLQLLDNIDDLIFLLAGFLQSAELKAHSADEIETVLDAFARLGAERPDDFALRTEAIRAKAEQTSAATGDPLLLAAAAWVTGVMPIKYRISTAPRMFTQASITSAQPSWTPPTTPADQLLRDRFLAVSQEMIQGRSSPLLSTPTHQGGWIDPLILVQRVARDLAAGQIGDKHKPPSTTIVDRLLNFMGLAQESAVQNTSLLDQSLALLRLAPDNRPLALSQMSKLPQTEFIDAFRYALGVDDVAIGETAELWIAAARARNPFGDDLRIAARFPDLGPDATHLAQYKLTLTTESPRDHVQAAKSFRLLERSPSVPANGKADNLITVRMHQMDYSRWHFEILIDWRRSITPANLDAFFAEGIEKIGRGAYKSDKTNLPYLELLYAPDVSITRLGLIMLALGLTSEQKDEHATAVEALIAAIDDGRLTGTELGRIMSELFYMKAFKIERLDQIVQSLGLTPEQKGDRAAVRNALYKAIFDGRVVGSDVRRVMHELFQPRALQLSDRNTPVQPLVSLSRWAKALALVSRCSTYHALAVALCLEELCRDDPDCAPKDLHLLLEILLFCLVEANDCVENPQTRQYLTALSEKKGTTKTAKLVKQLLNLKRGPRYEEKRQEALAHVLEKRLERAERWVEWRRRDGLHD